MGCRRRAVTGVSIFAVSDEIGVFNDSDSAVPTGADTSRNTGRGGSAGGAGAAGAAFDAAGGLEGRAALGAGRDGRDAGRFGAGSDAGAGAGGAGSAAGAGAGTAGVSGFCGVSLVLPPQAATARAVLSSATDIRCLVIGFFPQPEVVSRIGPYPDPANAG